MSRMLPPRCMEVVMLSELITDTLSSSGDVYVLGHFSRLMPRPT